MSEVFAEMYKALNQLRNTLQEVEISPKIKEKMEELLTPLFANEANCQRITDIINEVGDFTENILVPLLEQYVSAKVAIKVKFLVEDLLTSVETYRDTILKKLAKSNNMQSKATRQDKVVDGSSMMRRLALNSVTNHYRDELYGSKREDRGKMQLKPYMSLRNTPRMLTKNSKINASFRVVDKVNEQAAFRPAGSRREASVESCMAAIISDKQQDNLREVVNVPVPEMDKSGQVLIKVIAVGLNHVDYSQAKKHMTSFSVSNDDLPAPINTVRKSFLSFSQSFLAVGDSDESKAQRAEKKGKKILDSVIGVEFCGVVQDIAWQKGDFLHRLHISRDDIVFGVLKGDEGLSKGALGELVVCDVNDICRVPTRLASSPAKAASLPLDGALVCRSLATTDITNPRNSKILVLGGATNLAVILIEVLTKDMKIRVPANNIHVLVSPEQKHFVRGLGISEANIHVFSDNDASWVDPFTDGFFDVVFDCISETSFTTTPFLQVLEKKVKPTGQITTMDSSRLLAEKKGRNEDWQKELQMLSRLINERRITLPTFSDTAIIDLTAQEVGKALEALRSGRNEGKTVVSVSPQSVQNLRNRVLNQTTAQQTL